MTEQTTNIPSRIFKIGTTTIQADESLANLDNEQVRTILKRSYPEVAHATIREHTDESTGVTVISYMAAAGRKG